MALVLEGDIRSTLYPFFLSLLRSERRASKLLLYELTDFATIVYLETVFKALFESGKAESATTGKSYIPAITLFTGIRSSICRGRISPFSRRFFMLSSNSA